MGTRTRAEDHADHRDSQSALFRAIVDNSADAIAVIDPQLRLVFASPSGWQFLGYEPSELLGKEVLQVVHPDDVTEVLGHFTATLATPGEAPPREFRVLTRDGQSRHVETRATNRLDDPAVGGLILVVRDVSERVYLTRALRTLGEGNQALVRSTDELGLLRRMCDTVVDAGGYPLAWVGYAEDDEARTVQPVAASGAVGYVRDLRISWADDEYGRGPTGTAIRTGEVQVMRDMRQAASFNPWLERAKTHGFLTSLVLPLSTQGRVIGALSIYADEVGAFSPEAVSLLQALADDLTYGIARLRDATQLSRDQEASVAAAAERLANQREHVERIEKLDRQKSDFLATVSHELRTPLASISGYLEVLRDKQTGELTTQQQHMLDVISRNAVRLRSLIEAVLVLSRIEGEVDRAGFVEVPVRGLITRAAEELSVLARGVDIELEVDAGPPEAVVLGNPESLERAVVNILSNAIKFSRPRGVVTIKAMLDRRGPRVLVTCQDHGIGIPAQDLADLFTRFFRASNAQAQMTPGTGLGLSIAKQIVEDHGGELRLISAEGDGTTVFMDLPLCEPSRPGPR